MLIILVAVPSMAARMQAPENGLNAAASCV